MGEIEIPHGLAASHTTRRFHCFRASKLCTLQDGGHRSQQPIQTTCRSLGSCGDFGWDGASQSPWIPLSLKVFETAGSYHFYSWTKMVLKIMCFLSYIYICFNLSIMTYLIHIYCIYIYIIVYIISTYNSYVCTLFLSLCSIKNRDKVARALSGWTFQVLNVKVVKVERFSPGMGYTMVHMVYWKNIWLWRLWQSKKKTVRVAAGFLQSFTELQVSSAVFWWRPWATDRNDELSATRSSYRRSEVSFRRTRWSSMNQN